MRIIGLIIVTSLAMMTHTVRFYRDTVMIDVKRVSDNAAIWLDDAKKAAFWGAIRFAADVIITCTPNLHNKTNASGTTL